MKTRSILTVFVVSVLALPSSCAVDHRIGVERGADPASFVSDPDSGAPDATEDSGGHFTNYCPSNRCPPGHTTCPSSQFLCDVDLLTDLNNCGECGNMCPADNRFVCSGGRCVLSCQANTELDCDGLRDNGCETRPDSTDHCGACGNKCPAGEPCVGRGLAAFVCGCDPGEINCGGVLPCVDPSRDDKNCGACSNACPREGDGTALAPPNAYFGCVDHACGKLKCNPYFSECDGLADNGCETFTASDDNCGGCGRKCRDGTTCRLNELGIPVCQCPQGQTLCEQGSVGALRFGTCKDLSSDSRNCGACGIACALNVPGAREACVYGKCEATCLSGWGDCNGNREDGCETRIASDPKNCGGCGIVCDGIAGQACVDGQCMVEPCSEPDAGGPR